MPCLDLCFELFNLAPEFLEVVEQSLNEHTEGARELVVGVFDQFWHPRSDIANALRNDEAKLAEQAANLIGLRRTRLHEALANPVQCQHRLLLNILDRHKAHVRSTNSLADGLGVGCIILVGLDVGLNELGCHQAYGVAHCLKLACPVMRAAAGLHAEQTRRQVDEECRHLVPA